jgi:hypothetical protein
MHKNAPFLLALLYSVLFAAAVCIVFYGGYVQYITHVYLIGLLFMLPFIFATVWLKRKRMGGVLGGREGVKEGLRFVIAATLYMSLFQVIFFELDFKEYKINFMQTMGPDILKEQIKAGTAKISEADIPKIISEDIREVTVFKEITSVVFKNLFFGSFCSFLAAILFKKKA